MIYQLTSKLSIALLCSIVFLTSCSTNEESQNKENDNQINTMCIAGFTQTSKNEGTLSFYTKSGSKPPVIEDIKNVSIETAEEITSDLGLCNELIQ